jgi:hypothetical protein
MQPDAQPASAEPVPPAVPTFRSEWEIWRLQLRLPVVLQQNPGLVLTLVYVAASLIGIIFNFLYFRRFGFNVLEFSEASDFLMVVVREPLTVALALLGVPVYLGYMMTAAGLSAWMKRTWPRTAGTPEKQEKTRRKMQRIVPFMQFGFIGVYALVFVVMYSKYQANRIKAADRAKVIVEYNADAPSTRPAPIGAALIGTTARFVFLYFHETKEAEVVPVDAIARLTWDARFGKEKQPAVATPAPAP